MRHAGRKIADAGEALGSNQLAALLLDSCFELMVEGIEFGRHFVE